MYVTWGYVSIIMVQDGRKHLAHYERLLASKKKSSSYQMRLFYTLMMHENNNSNYNNTVELSQEPETTDKINCLKPGRRRRLLVDSQIGLVSKSINITDCNTLAV